MTDLDAQNPVRSNNRWGILLSGGSGTRLREWIFRRRGDYLPKQYVNIVGKRSMLEHTWDRAEKLIPAEKLLVVITREHLQFSEVRRQLASRPKESIIVQPENKDTGPGVLLPLLHLHKRDPNAVVTVFPSDHFIREEDRFMQHIEGVFRIVESAGERIALLGIEPNEADPEYGYILSGRSIDPPGFAQGRPVEMFVEKPSVEAAKMMMRSGALWNTLVFVVTCTTLLQAIERAAPELYRAFEPIHDAIGTPDERRVTERVYHRLPAVNFSKNVLEALSFRDRQNLRVLAVRGVTWNDWGTSARLTKTLRQLGVRDSTHGQARPSERNRLRLA